MVDTWAQVYDAALKGVDRSDVAGEGHAYR